jgi:simple sugar transport system ATP-binding protein
MSDYIVEMTHITKRFPGIVANDDISISIKPGEIYAILGENGAGKSTLMSILFGMYEPDEGEIRIRGEAVKLQSPNHAAKLNIGMVHQHFKLVSEYTIAENIILGSEPMKKLLGFIPMVDMQKANKDIKALSEAYGLEVNPTDVIADVNVSTRQRVEILKMLYREAQILIFDEPTAVLTPQEIQFLLQILRNLKQAGKTILLITHKLEEIKQIADRCAVLNRGKLVGILDVATTTTKQMANLMVGREVEFTLAKEEAKFGKTVLDVSHLTIHNKQNFPVVQDVSFQIREGEIFAIAGVAGNGQVEIGDAIAGLQSLHSGVITLGGSDITKASIRQRTQVGIAYIPEDRQDYGLVMDFSLADNLVLKEYYREPYARNGMRNTEAVDTHSRDLITAYDIRSGQGSATVVRSMSGGNQQKAIIAREIQLNASLMIFVQPTRGLDIGAAENIHKQMLEERGKGKAILLISLELDEIMNLADTIAVIYNGKFGRIAPAQELTPEEVGEYMMGVKTPDKNQGAGRKSDHAKQKKS